MNHKSTSNLKNTSQTIRGGFTLIELLVVIAIIGILAAVVLTAMGDVRNRAKVANIQATLRNAQTAGEIYYNSNSFTYANICSDPQIQEFISSLEGLDANVKVGCYVHSSVQDLQRKDWAISVYFAENNYSVNPQGVVTFDTENTVSDDVVTAGGNAWANSTHPNWNEAITACSFLGKRAPSAAQLRALHEAHNQTVPTNPSFHPTRYWSNIEANPTQAWQVHLNDGVVSQTNKEPHNSQRLRCVS